MRTHAKPEPVWYIIERDDGMLVRDVASDGEVRYTASIEKALKFRDDIDVNHFVRCHAIDKATHTAETNA